MGDLPSETKLDPVGVRHAARLLLRVSSPAANEVLRRLMPTQAQAVRRQMRQLAGIQSQTNEPRHAFDFLSSLSQSVLFKALLRERPQAIAVLLQAAPDRLIPGIIRALSDQRRVEVIARLTQLGEVDAATIRDLETGLKQRIAHVNARVQKTQLGVQGVVQILTACDRPTEWSVIRNLGQDNPELTEEIQQMLFDFEDIVNLSDDDVQKLTRNVLSETWATALTRCSDFVRRKVFFNLSPRAAQQVRAEMNYIGDPLPSEIDRCQQRVIDVARKLNVSLQKRAA